MLFKRKMDKDARVLSNLIENLEDIKGKLSSLDYDRKWIDCILPREKSRSYINMKNVLESLVMKTVEGKGYDEDIASICNQHKPFLEKHLRFQNLFTSDEYLIEATNLPKMPLKFEFLHSSLTTFQEFLGDILHSVCQISSCQLNLPSRILVKDILKLKNQYLSIWDLISSVFGEHKCHRDSDLSLMGESKGINSQVGDIQKCLQMTLKEMSRVKLEIEHYFKCNLLEMQFTKSPYDADGGASVSLSKLEKLRNIGYLLNLH